MVSRATTEPLEATMNQHHLIATELVDLRRRDLQADADRHRPIRRSGARVRHGWLHR